MNSEEFLEAFDLDEKVYAREALIMNVTEDILVAMEEKSITKADLARLLHKSKSFVTQTLSGSRNMTLRTLTDIAFNLDLIVSIDIKHKAESLEIEHDNYQWNQCVTSIVHHNRPSQRFDYSAITSNDTNYRSAKVLAAA